MQNDETEPTFPEMENGKRKTEHATRKTKPYPPKRQNYTTKTTTKSFRRHYRSWVIPRIRVGVQIQMALHLLFGSLELICGYTAGAVMGVLCLRLAIMVSLTAFSWMTLDKKFHRVMDALTLGFYTVSRLVSWLLCGALVGGCLLMAFAAVFGVCCTVGSGVFHEDICV